MNGAEKIITVIEELSKRTNTPKIELGTFQDGGIVANNIVIPSSMVYKFDFLAKKRCVKVDYTGTVGTGGGGESPHTHPYSWVDSSTYIDELQNGDSIAFYQLNDSKFLILGRVV